MSAKRVKNMPATVARRRRLLPLRLLLGLVLLAQAAAACAQSAAQTAVGYKAEITDVDREAFPRIRVRVSITDSQGSGIPDTKQVRLLIQEDGNKVVEQSLSEGLSTSAVLVLDTSGSMSGEKLRRAKEAARAYLRMVPDTYRFALVGVSTTAAQLCAQPGAGPPCGFTNDVSALSNRIEGLSASGGTALQDGFGLALDLLRGRSDRKVIVALTDGLEVDSKSYVGAAGRQALIDRGVKEKSQAYTIGLGSDADAVYLRGLAVNGGKYLSSPDAAALRGTFEQVVKLLQRERVFVYDSPAKDPDGLERILTVRLVVDGKVSEEKRAVVAPGVIPHVRGDHVPYVAAVLFLILAPGLFAFAGGLRSVHGFRSASVVRLDHYSPLLGKRDPNVAVGGRTFREGDVVVLCPSCPKTQPYHIRSWRLLGCVCQYHPGGEVCYHRRLPRWLRYLLDSLSGRSVGETGRSWLCRCAGDPEGY
ncbi:MAG TPA: vWA domain-containing protein [Pyrinomonadaceae bacterium]|nr:vWA domain-containing protein [Pyrinomonadaceae bacterium]